MKQCDYTVQRHRGRIALFENDEIRPVTMYCPGDAFGNQAREDVDRFLDAGVTDFYLWVGRDEVAMDSFTTPFWPDAGELGVPAFVSADRFYSLPERIDYIVGKCPSARFLLRYYAHAPKGWKEAFPEEMAIDENGVRLNETSLASRLYEDHHRVALTHMVRWIESQPWAWRVMGYISLHEFEGTTSNGCQGMLFDYSAPMQKRFREHAPKWDGVPNNRFSRAREAGGYFHWPEPKDTEIERDYLELLRILFFRRCEVFVQTIQKAVGARKILIGMDALKQGMQGWICSPFFSGQAPRSHHFDALVASGSIGVDDIFRIPGLNIINTPYDYIFRHMGGSPEPEGIVDSCLLRGKMFLVEDDCRSFAAAENGSFGFFRNSLEAKAGIWRNAAAAIARGYHAYWMDVTGFPSPRGGYFRDESIMNVIKQVIPVIRKSCEWPHADVPGIAMIVDDRSALSEDFSIDFQNLAVIWQRLVGLSQCGVPYRVYLWEDLLNEDFPDHRLVIFPNLFRIDDQRLNILRTVVCRRGRVVLWGPGTGIVDGDGLSADWASRAIGMPMELLRESFARRVVMTRFDHPITSRLRGSLAFGDSVPYGPILLPEVSSAVSEQGVVLTTRGVNRVGFAIKELGHEETRWTSVFTAALPVPFDLIREMARYAGAHVYSEENDVVLVSKEFLSLHSTRVGERRIKLPNLCSVWDLIADQELYQSTDIIEYSVAEPETRVFRLSDIRSESVGCPR